MASYIYLSVCLLLMMTSDAEATNATAECNPSVRIIVGQNVVADLTAEHQVLFLGPSSVCDGGDQDNSTACYGIQSDDQWVFNLNSPLDCGATVTYDDDILSFEYVVGVIPETDGTIRRGACGSFKVNCTMNRQHAIKSNVLNVAESVVTLASVNITENYTTALSFMTDSSYATPLTSSVELNTYVYVEASVDQSGNSYNIGVKDCYAASSSGELRYDLINSAGNAVNTPFVEVTLQNSTTAQFNFESFLWNSPSVNGVAEVYVTCTTVVCLKDSDCLSMPSTRRRRRKRRSNQAEGDSHQLTIGPLRVLSNEKKAIEVKEETSASLCAMNNGGCQDICINTIGSSRPLCACNAGRVLGDDGFTCMNIANLQRTPQKVYTEIRSVEKSGVSETTIVIAAVAIIALLNILGVFIIVSRKGKKYPV